eukprot:595981-Prymnesium_polylepis.1
MISSMMTTVHRRTASLTATPVRRAIGVSYSKGFSFLEGFRPPNSQNVSHSTPTPRVWAPENSQSPHFCAEPSARRRLSEAR